MDIQKRRRQQTQRMNESEEEKKLRGAPDIAPPGQCNMSGPWPAPQLMSPAEKGEFIKKCVDEGSGFVIDQPAIYYPLNDADLHDTDLRRADLQGTILDRADLRSCNLEGANLTEASLCETDLAAANCINVNLEGANLSGANLVGISSRAHALRCQHFKGANGRRKMCCDSLSAELK
jgi:hypothetical protein